MNAGYSGSIVHVMLHSMGRATYQSRAKFVYLNKYLLKKDMLMICIFMIDKSLPSPDLDRFQHHIKERKWMVMCQSASCGPWSHLVSMSRTIEY